MPNQISEQELNAIRQKMLKFAELQLHNHELAEDLVQESFLSAFKNIGHFKREAAFKTWMFAILKNKIIDYLRQKGRVILESEIEEDDSPNSFFDDSGHWNLACTPSNLREYEEKIYAEEFWLIFEACLTCLPAQQARIFMMREFLELSSDEICHETQVSTSNLHTTLYRARLQLQHCLSQKL
ncbi:sigma-70 family RNA polymerase sigma factor [Rodentibacter trehalosifermentans]|uniref:RNA polymerase subunit sigma n=1 Tax=Rodentibacter trehalosifermentans TaxID=1908263 RepID=A0A1V3IZL9_9PAST|nr:sigma-70 family RNA polymerase sigma factor [Rodentibacter trehalosifermentans]OOF43141.1 RNA polymerase subunit sigma [Rodentibacter trehalosifermentans]OOF47553.1 RNA polymerase subunit sigma [Rodentibacter trehalosifermentans]OOF51870.1 RNA polymerase subunit sigma [Rodentibacter trehalosifermentans]